MFEKRNSDVYADIQNRIFDASEHTPLLMSIRPKPIRLFSICLMVCFFSHCSKKKEQTRPRISDVTESVYASATVKAEDQFTIFPTLNGTLKEVYVEAGDTVTEGQALFLMDDQTSTLSAENARLAYQLSEENAGAGSDKIRESELAIKLAKEKSDLDSEMLQKQKFLWSQGVGSKSDLDQKTIAFENSRTNLETARSRLLQLKTQLNNEKEKARNNLNISLKQKQDFVIRSVRKGRIFDVLKKKGEVVSPQIPVAIAGDATRYRLELEVDQADITRIRTGMKVEVTLESYKGQVFEASVTKIYPIMDERSRTFKVDARFLQTPPSLFPNLSAEANILISEKSRSITIPVNYLVDGKYVLVNETEKKEVKTGLKDLQKVEVLEGLDTTTVIYKP